MSEFWFRDGRWWHPLIVGTALANAVVAGFVAASADNPTERVEGLVATGALLLLVVVWFLFGVTSIKDPRRGPVLVALVTLLVTIAMVLVPWTGFVQTLVYPLVWLVFKSPKRSILISVVIALGIGVVSALYNGVEEIPEIIPGQLFSIASSCGIGFAITFAWRVADERRELLEQLTASQESVQELSRLSGASVERERISRDLHDTLAQTLAGLAMLADRSAKEIGRLRDEEAAADEGAQAVLRAQEERADLIASLARDALAEARVLIAENAPVQSVDPAEATFAEALARLAERFRRESGVRTEAKIDVTPGALDREGEVVLLRCAQEALSNARRHSDASTMQLSVEVRATSLVAGVGATAKSTSSTTTSTSTSTSTASPATALPASAFLATTTEAAPRPTLGEVVLTISDDGQGFDISAQSSGYGLASLRDRASAIGGSVDVASAPGRGTIVTVTIPAKTGDDS